ncbi:MAG: helix-turn-helix transcriptional regulator [Cyclobacteriaceae bacterium]
MKGTYLGEFEEVVMLTVGVLDDQAYGVSVRKEIEVRMGRNVTLSTVHSALHRLESKEFLESELGEATNERGGKRKRLFKMTNLGRKALEEAREIREGLWKEMPSMAFNRYAWFC